MSKSRGAEAEDRAAEYLERRGLRVIARNWRCRFGELDLVLRDGPTIVITEVRLRTHGGYGGAAESIDRRKQAKLAAAAQLYLSRLPPAPCRFDVVLLDGAGGAKIEWIRDAFRL